MVSKPVAAAGSVLGLTALAMLISVMVSQNFVVVTIPGKLNVYTGKGAAGTCQAPNYLGTLGIFKASYLPACTYNPVVVPPNPTNESNLSPYASLAEVTTPTTEFGPLFPAQTCIGGKLGACGFTTCEEFYAEGGATDQKLAFAAALKASEGLRNPTLLTAEMVRPLTDVLKRVPGYVGAAMSAQVAPILRNTTSSLRDLAKVGVGLVSEFAKLVSSCANVPGNTVLFKDDKGYNCSGIKALIANEGGCSTLSLNNAPTPTQQQLQALCGALKLVNGTDDAAKISTLEKGPLNLFNPTTSSISVFGFNALNCSLTGKAALPVCIQNLSSSASGGLTPDTDAIKGVSGILFGFVLLAGAAQDATRADIISASWVGADSNDFGVLKTLTSKFLEKTRGPGVDTFQDAWASMAACNSTSLNDCVNAAAYTPLAATAPLSSDDVTSGACMLLELTLTKALKDTALNYTYVSPTTRCTYSYLLQTQLSKVLLGLDDPVAKASLEVALGNGFVNAITTALPQGEKPAEAAFKMGRALKACMGTGLSAARCPDFVNPEFFPLPGLAQDKLGLPRNFTTPHPLAFAVLLVLVKLPVAEVKNPLLVSLENATFSNLLRTLVLAEGLLSDEKTMEGLKVFLGAATFKLVEGLSGLVDTGKATQECQTPECFIARMYPVGYSGTGLINGTSRPQRIADCLNNDKDISAFKTAQAMVTAAAVMMGLGMAAGFAALAVDKGPVAFGAGALSAIGGVLVVAALMVVKGAPVYSKIGGTPVDGKPLYSAAPGQLIAIVGGLLAIIGGITQAVSGCLNKAGSSDQLTTKVENTY